MRVSLIVIVFLLFLIHKPAHPGVSNPDISAIGQMLSNVSDADSADTNPDMLLGEAELVLDAALNPYANGRFVFAVGEEGIAVEEAYVDIVRGLPLNLGMRIGRYRTPFGRINSVHPHTLPFVAAPRCMRPEETGLIPGTESFSDQGVQLSTLLPVSNVYALTLSADFLEGGSFHPESPRIRYAWNARALNSFSIGDASLVEVGLSAARGTNDPAFGTHDLLVGADAKAKRTFEGARSITLGAELVNKTSEAKDTVTGAVSEKSRNGGYLFADFRQGRLNGGLLYEQFESEPSRWTKAVRPFIGFSLLEESTVLKLTYERLMPWDGRAINGLQIQFLFSMGPHKAHTF